jgi:hypothetical protein
MQSSPLVGGGMYQPEKVPYHREVRPGGRHAIVGIKHSNDRHNRALLLASYMKRPPSRGPGHDHVWAVISGMNQRAATASLRNLETASKTTKSEAARVAQVMRNDLSTPVSLIGRAVNVPATPVHQ